VKIQCKKRGEIREYSFYTGNVAQIKEVPSRIF